MARKVIIATRGSLLALWQTNWVKAQLEKHHPGLGVEINVITTKGDRVLDVSLPKLGEQGKGLFTKELEDALFEVKRVIVGQDRMVERAVICLLAGGHALIGCF